MFISRASIWFSMLLAIWVCAGTSKQTSAQVLKKDDLAFRKQTYTDKQGNKMPYRLFVPANYDPSQKYALIFWLHGGSGRGAGALCLRQFHESKSHGARPAVGVPGRCGHGRPGKPGAANGEGFE